MKVVEMVMRVYNRCRKRLNHTIMDFVTHRTCIPQFSTFDMFAVWNHTWRYTQVAGAGKAEGMGAYNQIHK